MERNLLRIQNRVFPRSPKTSNSIKIAFEDPQIMMNFGKTKHEDPRDFFKTVFDTPQFSYCIFASNAVIDLMEKTIPVSERSFLMDATFKICPLGQFNQLLIIAVEYANRVNILKFVLKYLFLTLLHIFLTDCAFYFCFNEQKNKRMLPAFASLH
jgi:hypothetical protein